MVVVGALARIVVDDREALCGRLEGLDGVTTFGLPENERIGLILEMDDLGQAQRVLQEVIQEDPGVLGVWPISMHSEHGFAAGTEDDERKWEV